MQPSNSQEYPPKMPDSTQYVMVQENYSAPMLIPLIFQDTPINFTTTFANKIYFLRYEQLII